MYEGVDTVVLQNELACQDFLPGRGGSSLHRWMLQRLHI